MTRKACHCERGEAISIISARAARRDRGVGAVARDIGAEPLARLLTDDARQLGLAREQFVEIDDIEHQERAVLCGDDGSVAWVTGQEGQFAEEMPGSETERVGLQLHL